MRRPQMALLPITLAVAVSVSCVGSAVPDLQFSDASAIIALAPEFSRYARLIKVERLDHAKESMDSVTFGEFAFQYLSAPSDAAPIEANVEFMYHEGKWYLNQFDYGCPRDCHIVHVYDGPEKKK